MITERIERDFQNKVCRTIRLSQTGVDRFRVFTPFIFEDGDHLVILLKRVGKQWLLGDEGHTYMHLTYDLDERDLQSGTRQSIISDALAVFSVEDRDGELVIPIQNDRFGDALYSMIQAILKITDVAFLSRERVRSTFMEDFRAFMEESIPAGRRQFDWFDRKRDPDGNYPVDCRINSTEPSLFVYAINGNDKARDVHINLLQFERWGLSFRSLGIFENQEEINRKVLARLSDVIGKQYSTLAGNKERVSQFLKELLQM